MIVAEQKPFEEIKSLISEAERVLVVGCGTCVTVCFAGGSKEAAILGSSLRMATQLNGNNNKIDEVTVQRQCEWEYIAPLEAKLDEYDLVLSLGCGVGVQTLAERFPTKRVVPGLNTSFMGLPVEQGVWEERCQACGNCILHLTGGICPISRCSKQLLNGPCGGSQNGQCEIDPEIPCAWELIWERMTALGLQEQLLTVQPPKDWTTSRDGGPRRIIRDDLRLPKEYQE
jgi:ferredoxin